MNNQVRQANKRFKLFAYVVAWFAFAGAFFTQCSKVGDVVRDSFNNIHIPKKENFFE